jgi:arylsulfatase A-like enzyme
LHLRGSALAIDGFTLTGITETRAVKAEAAWLQAHMPPRAAYRVPAVHGNYPVVMIQLESWRHDLGTMIPSPIPFMKSLETESIVFQSAYAPASHSDLADLAIWYAQYPLRGKLERKYPADADWRGMSIFGAMKAASYHVGYVSSQDEKWGGMINWLKTPDVDYFFHSEDYKGPTWENKDDKAGLYGMLQRGEATAGKVEDSETLRIAQEWIRSLEPGTPFFLRMNLQNSHFSYFVPPGSVAPYRPYKIDFEATYYVWPQAKKDIVRNRYLDAVNRMDQVLGQFAEKLKKEGICDNCYFVITGDSGEVFYEHGFGNHSGSMYDEVERPYTLIKPQKALMTEAPSETRPINLIDLAAIVLDDLGLPLPSSFQCTPFPQTGPGRPVFMYSDAIVSQSGIVDGQWKLLKTRYPTVRRELYRLYTDPQEPTDLSARYVAEADRLSAALALWRNKQTAYFSTPDLYNRKAAPLLERDRH